MLRLLNRSETVRRNWDNIADQEFAGMDIQAQADWRELRKRMSNK
jgi:hypothetical protein